MNKFKYLLFLSCILFSINSYTIEKEECEPSFLEFHASFYTVTLFNMWRSSSTAKENIQECAKLYKDEETAFALLIRSIVDFYNQDIASFYKKIKISANMGYSPAQYYLATFYGGYSVDSDLYMYWLKQAKNDKSFPVHLLIYANETSNEKLKNEAVQILYEHAKSGKWIDIVNLVNTYSEGVINNINIHELFKLSEITLDELLEEYSHGEDTLFYAQLLMDHKEQLITLKTLAEESKNTSAMMLLYELHNEKSNEIYDPNKAAKWLQKAIDNDHENSLDMYVWEYIYENNELPYEESLKTLKKNFNNGYIFSAYILGEVYKNGEIRFPKDMDKAIEWYEKAAEYDQIGALSALVHIYEDQGNEEKLVYYLKKLATHPHPEHSKTAKAKLENLEK